jgi:hypothetical protein
MEPYELVETYVDAFNAADQAACLALYADDASISFMAKTYRGREAIAAWLTERFAAGAHIVNVNGVDASGQALTVHAAVTSKKLQAWRLGTINGRAEVVLDAEWRIAECRLAWDGFRPGARSATG